ncbi:MAG: hypothetical protein HON43_01755 [Alphaproteobacteria bacterium]|nr:hypothetical protein [Alphaproteobacteria bacterium]MBT5390636.1 hypothetical protein [Alphaproteobacteria bacterium]
MTELYSLIPALWIPRSSVYASVCATLRRTGRYDVTSLLPNGREDGFGRVPWTERIPESPSSRNALKALPISISLSNIQNTSSPPPCFWIECK